MILRSSDTQIIADYGCNKHYMFFSCDPHDIVDYGYDKHYIYIHIYKYIYIYGDTHDFAGYGYNKQHYMIVHDALYRSNLCNYMLWYVMVA